MVNTGGLRPDPSLHWGAAQSDSVDSARRDHSMGAVVRSLRHTKERPCRRGMAFCNTGAR